MFTKGLAMSQRFTRTKAVDLPAPELLTDPQGAALVNLGVTRFQELQKSDPTFPAPVWFGPRGKRHVRTDLLAWVQRRRGTVNGGA